MQREYTFHRQEREDWCVPACLQIVLESRGFELSQEEIAENLGIDSGNGLEADILKKLNEFLKAYGLSCIHTNPFIGGLESDLLLRDIEVSEDVLIAYGRERNGRERKHFSLVLSYDAKTDQVILLDPGREDVLGIVNTSLRELNDSIQAKFDKKYGFYIIS